MTRVFVCGVGMTPFFPPSKGQLYTDLAALAVRDALTDARVEFADIGCAYASYVYGDSTAGQRALYPVGMTGIPIININNNCASGSTALYLARQAIAMGAHDCVLAVGFEQMRAGAIGAQWGDRPDPLLPFSERLDEIADGPQDGIIAARLFGSAGIEHMKRFGTRPETFAMISVKARRHAAANERAVFRDPLTLEEVLAAKPIFGPLTRYQCCPPTSGAAAAVLASERFAKRLGLSTRVEIVSMAMETDRPDTFEDNDARSIVGAKMAARTAAAAYAEAAISPCEVNVAELHDCFTANELISYEALGFAQEGGAEEFILTGANTYGGAIVTNPSGGLLSKGHPLGATGLAQCAELTWQLRGAAGSRQVENARLGLQHNLGLGGACVVGIYAAND